MNQIGAFVPFLLIIGGFYFLVVRPARGRQRDQLAVVSRVAPGVRVMTTAGLFGTVVAVDDDQIDLEIATGVVVRYVAAAVAKIVEEPAALGTVQEPRASILEGDTPDV